MTAAPLRRIEASLAAMVAEKREHGTPIDDHALHCVAVQLGCLAEMAERGLDRPDAWGEAA